MSSIQFLRNGSSLVKALEEHKARDLAKQAQIEEAKVAEQKRLEAEKAKKQEKLTKEAERFAVKMQRKLEAGEACSRCYRAGFEKSCLTHIDAECIKPFCEECYAHVVEHSLESRKFATHETADCIHVKREQQKKFSLEMETEAQMLRRLKEQRVERRRREEAEEAIRQAERAKEFAEMKKQMDERLKQEKVAPRPSTLPIGEEARKIWGKKATEIIADHQKEVEAEEAKRRAEEEAQKAQKEAEIAVAKAQKEATIAEKKNRLMELRAKIREAKAKAEDKKISNTQQKKGAKEAKLLEKEGETLTVEITIDERQLRETLKRMRML